MYEGTYSNFAIDTGNPPSFACHRSTPNNVAGIITYTGCNLQTNGMDPKTGVFTVEVRAMYL